MSLSRAPWFKMVTAGINWWTISGSTNPCKIWLLLFVVRFTTKRDYKEELDFQRLTLKDIVGLIFWILLIFLTEWVITQSLMKTKWRKTSYAEFIFFVQILELYLTSWVNLGWILIQCGKGLPKFSKEASSPDWWKLRWHLYRQLFNTILQDGTV